MAALAVPGSFVHLFVDEGTPMAQLLSEASQKQHLQSTPKCLYANTVLQIYYLYIESVAQAVMTGHDRYIVQKRKKT